MGPWKTFPIYFLLYFFTLFVLCMQCRILLAWLMANCKRRRDLKNYTQINERGGQQRQRRRWWHVVDGFLKQPVTREWKRRRYGTLAACLPGWLFSWLQDQQDDARKRCNRRPRANAVWFTRNSSSRSNSSIGVSCLKRRVAGGFVVQIRGWLGHGSIVVVETGAARTLLSIENVPTICNDD